ncbi:DUF3857 domain-containing protein [Pedobacter sp. 22226]|uniref:DUF3857 domain-containing protein n=1 Tax=Pedobacter sp. 22226 TaxID=3453894 RepID=UPI003F837B67
MIKKITLSVCFILAMVSLAIAQKGKVAINPQLPGWLQKVNVVNSKPAYKNIQDGYYLFLFEKQNNIETKEQYSHIIREISNGTGVQNGSEISVSYDPSYEKLVFHKLTIWRDNKPMNKLSLQNFKILQNEKELSRFIYSGLYTAYLILDDIRKGDRIEYAYTIKGSNPVFPKYSNTIYFEGNSQIVNVYNNLIFKPGRNIQTKNFNDVPALKKSVVNGLNVFEWQNSMTKTYPANDFEPSDYDPFARVQVSEYNNWQEIVDWGLSLQKYNSKNSAIINEKVAELKLKAKGNKEKYLELATRFVQDEIRYMGIEIGEYSHRPNSPEKILKQRYGDCKDKSTLLCNLLNANGINAYSVFLSTYLKKETASLLPSPSIFNHETVVVEFDDRKIYIDPTVANQRGSVFNNYFPYTAKVLVIKNGNKELTETTQQNLGKLKSLVVFNVGDTVNTSKSTLRITSYYSNNYADNFRENLNTDGADNIEKSYVKYYSNLYPGLTIKEPIEIQDNETENIITVTEHYEIDSLWTRSETDQSKRLAYFYGDLINDQIISIKKFRNAPLSLKFPCTIEQEVRIILPEVWDFKNENINIDNDNYRFLYSAKAKSNTLTLTYYYQNFTSVLQPNNINDYIKDSKEILNTLSYGIYWNGTGPVENDGLNLKLLSIAFLVFLLSVFIAFYLYTRKTAFNLEAVKNAWRLGGWLALPGIGITLNPVIILVNALKQGIYTDKVWQGIQLNTHSLLLNLSVIFTVVFNVILFVFSIFILISFYKRRDLFPKYYIGFLIFSFLVTLLDTVASIYINKLVNNEVLGASEFYSVLRIGIFAAIWITYLLKSERVKQTFVFSYPDSEWRKAVVQDLNENFRINNLEQKENIIKEQETIDTEENERL